MRRRWHRPRPSATAFREHLLSWPWSRGDCLCQPVRRSGKRLKSTTPVFLPARFRLQRVISVVSCRDRCRCEIAARRARSESHFPGRSIGKRCATPWSARLGPAKAGPHVRSDPPRPGPAEAGPHVLQNVACERAMVSWRLPMPARDEIRKTAEVDGARLPPNTFDAATNHLSRFVP